MVKLTNKLAMLCLNTIWRNMEAWKQVKNNKGLCVLDVDCGKQDIIRDFPFQLAVRQSSFLLGTGTAIIPPFARGWQSLKDLTEMRSQNGKADG